MKPQECTATSVCSKCSVEQPLTEFYGVSKRCKTCTVAYLKEWRLKNKEKRKEQRRREYIASKDKLKAYSTEYRKKNPESTKAAQAKWSAEHKEYIAFKNRRRYAEDAEFREGRKASNSSRHKRLRISTPAWVHKKDLRPFFAEAQRLTMETGVMHHVDHIIPLQGKTVSGLTVPANLRVMVGAKNSRKSNKLVEDIV